MVSCPSTGLLRVGHRRRSWRSSSPSGCHSYLLFDNQDTWVSEDGAQWTQRYTTAQESIIAPNGMGQALASLGTEALLFGGLDTQLHATLGTFIFSAADGWRKDSISDTDPSPRYFHAIVLHTSFIYAGAA